ncbi:hypothetical protein [secondary endosymbiont of Heteropsylla cubana]|nr:hypothetical protein [secondary endosymbiont of Heteropsylla cubana]
MMFNKIVCSAEKKILSLIKDCVIKLVVAYMVGSHFQWKDEGACLFNDY